MCHYSCFLRFLLHFILHCLNVPSPVMTLQMLSVVLTSGFVCDGQDISEKVPVSC